MVDRNECKKIELDMGISMDHYAKPFYNFCQSCLNVNPDFRVKHIGTEHRLVVQCLADKELVKNAKESNKYNNVQVSLSRDYQTSFGCPESTILY